MIDIKKKELISLKVIKTLYSRFENFPENSLNNRNAPFHEAFLKAFVDKFEGKVSDIPFFISLSSWLHGLNTTLGQSFFEDVAHILSDGQKKSFTKKENRLLKITQRQKENISNIITDLKNGNCEPDVDKENELIFITDGQEIEANNFTADVFIEDDNQIVCIELKSVKPNAGEMRGEKQKILEAKAALFHTFPEKKIKYYIGFPFDPTNDVATGSDKNIFLNSIIDGQKYYDHREVLLADELWDFLSSDTNTMQQILDTINSIAKPDFKEKYNSLINRATSIVDKKNILDAWNLISEIKLLDNDKYIQEKIKTNKRLKRIYKKDIFNKGEYDFNRYFELENLLE